jgi:hypothetical protein
MGVFLPHDPQSAQLGKRYTQREENPSFLEKFFGGVRPAHLEEKGECRRMG